MDHSRPKRPVPSELSQVDLLVSIAEASGALPCAQGGLRVHRVANFLLWGGLALFILGVVSCGVGCVTATASVAGGSQGGFVAGGGLGVLGLVALILCVVMAMTGAVLKAFLSLVGGGRR